MEQHILFVCTQRKALGLDALVKGRPYGFFANVLRLFNLATEELVEPERLGEWCECCRAEAEVTAAELAGGWSKTKAEKAAGEVERWCEEKVVVEAYYRYVDLLCERGLADFAFLQRHAYDLLTNYGALMAEKGNAEQAAESFERAVRADPQYPNAYYDLGLLAMKEGKPEEAIATLDDMFAKSQSSDYVALQAYLQPTEETTATLQALRARLRLATTLGYGPRYLHSTGQLHKSDAGRGLFIQLTADDPQDAPIPDEAGEPASSITFGLLKTAQALLDGGRRVIRFHLGGDAAGGLRRLAEHDV